MQTPAELPFYVDRWVPCVRRLPVVNADLTDATFAMQVRLTGDQPGTPLIDLGTVSTDIQGVRLIEVATDTLANHIAAGRLASVPAGYAETDSLTVSLLGIRIDEATISALPLPAETGDNLEIAWDIVITPFGSDPDKYAGGAFIVRAGVTQ
ncbi:MAG: hypothetical protein ACR652_17795 [Methylocystis sp.]|uniref:hypothetical protein n=1 Tax=Methylocystis sp. TaxID=1911079 RepID=UPI003DA58649